MAGLIVWGSGASAAHVVLGPWVGGCSIASLLGAQSGVPHALQRYIVGPAEAGAPAGACLSCAGGQLGGSGQPLKLCLGV